MPDAALGAGGYLLELALTVPGSNARWWKRPWLVAILGANSVAMACAGVTLVVLQASVVQAWCLLCLVSAAISFALACLAAPEVLAMLHGLSRNWRDSHSVRTLWQAFVGRAAQHPATSSRR